MEDIITRADQYEKRDNFKGCFALLAENLATYPHPELYWRLARCCYDEVYALSDRPSKAELKEDFAEMLKFASKGFELDPENPKCLTWYGIAMDEIAGLDGMQQRVKKSAEFEPLWKALYHLLKAEEIQPRMLVHNMLHVAKCYRSLKEFDQARQFCKYVIEYEGEGFRVNEAKSEVRAMLTNLP
ncbi:unnamed protein product [Echinostoma caproni]|uniref:TPR_REGION domain-containing protein n=1 Tax=Echinostoma caproni TaxID=27848 RepID=A0A183ANP4_9TREM|nr:unnamed protein product [Echinostoma caproni]